MKKNFNVLYIAHYYRARDSASITTHGIIRGLISRGHTVTLLTPDRCNFQCPCSLECSEDEKLRVIRTPTFLSEKAMGPLGGNLLLSILNSTVAYLLLFTYALKETSKRKFDVIMCMHHPFHLATFCASKLSSAIGAPFIVKAHDIILPTIIQPSLKETVNWFGTQLLNLLCLRRALRKASYVLVTSNESKEVVEKMFDLGENQVVAYPNGVDSRRFMVNPKERVRLRKNLGIETSRVVIFMGAFGTDRGLDILIESLPRVASECNNVKLLMIGEGPEERKLKEMAKSLNVQKRINFLGTMEYSSIPTHISVADICIGPLIDVDITYGATPRKVVECLACAKPVIACRGGVSSDLVIDGYNGLLISRDRDELAKAMITLLKNKNLARKLGENGRTHIKQNYDWTVVINKLDNLIARIV